MLDEINFTLVNKKYNQKYLFLLISANATDFCL